MNNKISDTTSTTRRAVLIGALGPALLSACGGGSSGTAAETLPQIAKQPVSVQVAAGSTAAFSVAVTNSNSVTYQWLRNGAEIGGATQSTFTWPSVSLLDSGATFSVRVSNGAGGAISQPATLTVTAAALTIIAGVVGEDGSYLDAVGGNARFDSVGPFAIDDVGNVFVSAGATIRKIAMDGTVTTLAGAQLINSTLDGIGTAARFDSIFGLTFDRTRRVLRVVTDGFDGSSTPFRSLVREVTLDGVVTTAQRFTEPMYRPIAYAPDGTLYATGGFLHNIVGLGERQPSAIYKASADGTAVLLAGNPNARGYKNGPATDALFSQISALAADGTGNVYVCQENTVRKIAQDGSVSTIAGSAGQAGVADGQGANARFTNITALTVDGSGNIIVADSDLIRRISTAGWVSTLAKVPFAAPMYPGQTYVGGIAFDNTGALYATGRFWVGRFEKFAG